MKICFSWLRKATDDLDRLSSLGSFTVCLLLLAGTLALVAEKNAEAENKAAETAQHVPARIAVRFENYVPAPPEEISETENAPEETPLTGNPEPPAPEISQKTEPAEAEFEKIDKSALRETLAEEAPNKEIPQEEVAEETPPEPEKPLEKIPETPPPQTRVLADPPPASVPAVDESARVAAEQTLYGALAEAVSRKKFYPKAARRNGRTGTVLLRVSIGICGKIKSVQTEKSAAHRSLVSGAEETLRRVADDFCAPAGTQSALPAVFVVPVIYELKKSR